MKYCNKCKVEVDGMVERCPLCYAPLIQQNNQPESQPYPVLEDLSQRYNIAVRIALLLSLTAGAVCLIINIITFRTVWWSFIVISNILYIWAAVYTAFRKRGRIGVNIMTQFVILSLLLIAIDRSTGSVNWSLNYVVPLLAITASLSNTIIIIFKRMAFRDFFIYFFITALLGFVPIILMAFQQVSVLWPSLTAALYSGISLVGMFILADKTTKTELKKRFHI
ncbi:DUF6320 domain-containing protein [Oscillospiraceae bacterium MB08-C2-2]|nr:DUF6320 domain-containing protein [Oscillospiraceae bacterium MB08-C2-2]